MTILLALVTGVALLGVGFTLGAPRIIATRPAATEQVVRDFYTAVNQAIATGDSTALEGMVADDLVTRGALASVAPGRDGLVRYLASLHATQPDIELAVVQVMAARDQVLVRLSVRGRVEGRFLSSPLRGSEPPWGTVEALKVEGKRVVEYWGESRGLTLMEPVGDVPIAVAPPTTRVVYLDRLSVAPGESFAAAGSAEARVLVVETGTIAVSTSPRADGPLAQASVVERLEAGDLLALPTWSRTDVRNEGTEAASVLVLAAGLTGVLGGPTPRVDMPETNYYGLEVESGLTRWQAGIARRTASGNSVTPLTGNVQMELPGERATVAVGRVTLGMGVTLPAFEVAGPQLVVANTGVVELTANGKSTAIARGTGSYLWSATPGTAGLADARLFNPGPDPAVVTIVAILPDDRAEPTS